MGGEYILYEEIMSLIIWCKGLIWLGKLYSILFADMVTRTVGMYFNYVYVKNCSKNIAIMTVFSVSVSNNSDIGVMLIFKHGFAELIFSLNMDPCTDGFPLVYMCIYLSWFKSHYCTFAQLE